MSIISTSLNGLNAATRAFDASATRVAQAGSPDSPRGDVDFAAETVQQIAAREAFAANAAVLQTAPSAVARLLDISV